MRVVVLRLVVFAALLAAAVSADEILAFLNVSDWAVGREFGRVALETLAWIAGAFLITGAVDVFVWDGVVARIAGRPVPRLLKNTLALIVVVIALAGIVGIVFGRDVTAIWATSGVVGIVLGFSLRSLIQDIFTGIALNLDGSVKAGDWVELHHQHFGAEQYGRVMEIMWRASRVQLENNNIIVVPNSMMGTMAVTNYAHADHTTRLEIEVVLDFDVPPERVCRILVAAALSAECNGLRREPLPTVVLRAANDRGIPYTVRFWGCVTENSPNTLRSAVMDSIVHALSVAGLSLAYPREDVFHAELPQRRFDHDLPEERAAIIARVDLFARALTPLERVALAEHVRVESVARGEQLLREGESGDTMFVLVEGMLEVTAGRDQTHDPVRVGRVRAGEILGEMSLLTGAPRAATATAVTDCVVYRIGRGDLEPLLAERPEIASRLSDVVAERQIRTGTALRDATEAEREAESRRLKASIVDRMGKVFVSMFKRPEHSRTN